MFPWLAMCLAPYTRVPEGEGTEIGNRSERRRQKREAEREAIKASQAVINEYARLQHRLLSAASIAAAPRRERVRALLPLAAPHRP